MFGQFRPSGELGFGIPDGDAEKVEGSQKLYAVLHTERCAQIRHEAPSPGGEIVGAAGVRTPSAATAPLTVTEQLGWPCVEILYMFHTKGKAMAPSSSYWPLKIGETLLISYFLSHPHVLLRLVHSASINSLLPILSPLSFLCCTVLFLFGVQPLF